MHGNNGWKWKIRAQGTRKSNGSRERRGRGHRSTHLNHIQRYRIGLCIAMLDVPLEVHVKKLEDKIELCVRVHDLQKPKVRVNCAFQRLYIVSELGICDWRK